MSETERPKKRRFWQLHLSTAVLLMLGAGGIGWLNSLLRFEYKDAIHSANGEYFSKWNYDIGSVELGWPFSAYQVDALLLDSQYGGMTPDKQIAAFESSDVRHKLSATYYAVEGRVAVPQGEPVLLRSNCILDGAVGLALLFMLAFVLEYLIRRREGRKP